MKKIKKLVRKEVAKRIARLPAGRPGPPGPQGLQGPPGQPGEQGAPGQRGEDATRLFAYIHESITEPNAVVQYGSGVSSVSEPPGTDGEYAVRFDRDLSNRAVQVSPGLGYPRPNTSMVIGQFPLVSVDDDDSSVVEVEWSRSSATTDFGVKGETSFFITAFC